MRIRWFEHAFFFSFMLFSMVELVILRIPQFGHTAGLFWMSAQVVMASFAMVAFIKLIHNLILDRSWSVLLILAYIGGFFLVWNSPTYIHHETTQQIGCIVRNWYDSSNTIRSNCFIGYPSRQYYLPALPTLVFGRSIETLRVGGMIYFFMGLSIFVFGWTEYFKRYKYRHIITVSILSLVPHFYYVTERVLYAEQSHYPFSYGLMLVGVLLLLKRSVNNIPLLTILGLLMLQTVYIYTPGLALIPFVAAVYFLFFLRDKTMHALSHWIWFYIVLITGIHLCLSLLFRHDIRIVNHGPVHATLLSDLSSAIQDFFHTRSEWIFLSPLISVGFLITTTLYIIGFGGWQTSVLAGWMAATMIGAVTFQGYFLADIHFRVQRWMVVLPIWMACIGFSMAYIVTRTARWKHHRRVLSGLLIIVLGYGILFQFTEAQRMRVTPPNDLSYQIWSSIPSREKTYPISVYIDKRFLNTVGSMNDSLQYFFTRSAVSRADDRCKSPSIKEAHIDVFIVPASHSSFCQINYNAKPITVISKSYLVDGKLEHARALIFSSSEK